MPNPLRKEITGLFTGVAFEIRRVKLRDYMAVLRDLPVSIVPSTVKELKDLEVMRDNVTKLTKEQIEDMEKKTVEFYLSRGVTRIKYPGEDWRVPNIWYGEDGRCPDGMVCVADFGADIDAIVQEISLYSFHVGGAPDLTGFFRDGGGGAGPGPGGGEVPPQAVGDAATGNHTGAA